MKLKKFLIVFYILTFSTSSCLAMHQMGKEIYNPTPQILQSGVEHHYHYFGQGEDRQITSIDYGNNTDKGHYVVSGDAKIYYEVYGAGKPVVLLHGGIVGSPGEMGELADKLKDNYKVIMISTRGHGRSEIGHASMSFEQKANDVAAVLKDAHIQDKIDLIGFSDGGYTGIYFAKQYPNQLDRLVAIGTGTWNQGFVQGGRKDMKSFDDVIALDKRYWGEQLHGVRPEPERVVEWFNKLNDYYSRVEVKEPVFKNISANTFLIVGEKDINAPLQTVIAAYKMISHVQLGVVPNAPHPVLQTDFDIVWPMIDKFLRQS